MWDQISINGCTLKKEGLNKQNAVVSKRGAYWSSDPQNNMYYDIHG